MLRRKPTALTLTTEDIAIYEDARAAEMLQREAEAKAQAHAQAQIQGQQNSDHLQKRDSNRDPGPKASSSRTREERLGISGRG